MTESLRGFLFAKLTGWSLKKCSSENIGGILPGLYIIPMKEVSAICVCSRFGRNLNAIVRNGSRSRCGGQKQN